MEKEDVRDAHALQKFIFEKHLANIKYFYSKLEGKKTFLNTFHETPLKFAIVTGDLHVVQLLVELGEDIYATCINNYGKETSVIQYSDDIRRGSNDYENVYQFLLKIQQDRIETRDEIENTPLMRAVTRRSIPAVRHLMNSGALPTARNNEGVTPFIAALITEDEELIDLLLYKMSKHEITNLLQFAVKRNLNWNIVEKLLDSGDDLETRLYFLKSEMHSLIKTYQTRLTDYLRKGCRFEQVIIFAINGDDLESVRFFKENYADLLRSINTFTATRLVEFMSDAMTRRGIPVDLFFLSAFNDLDILRICFENMDSKALNIKSLDAVDNNGDTILILSVKNNKIDSTKFIVEMGANACKADKNDRTPLDLAVINGNVAICRYLLQNGGKFTGKTALIHAIRGKHLEITELLLENSVPVNFVTKQGNTPLIESLMLEPEMLDIVKLLMKYGADPNLPNSEGKTPLQISVEKSFTSATKYLIEKGADVNNSLNKINGEHVLHKFLNDLDFEMVYFIIKHGADVNVIDKNNQCALVKMMELKHAKLVNLLLQNGANPYCEHFQETSLLSMAAAEEYLPVVEFLLELGACTKGCVKILQKLSETNENFEIFMKTCNVQLSDEENHFGNEAAPEAAPLMDGNEEHQA